jgi:hypothetical protein
MEEELQSAGFERFEVTRTQLVGDANNPRFLQAFVDEFAEIFEGLDESLGAEAMPLISKAIAELRALPRLPGGAMRYTPTISRAWR